MHVFEAARPPHFKLLIEQWAVRSPLLPYVHYHLLLVRVVSGFCPHSVTLDHLSPAPPPPNPVMHPVTAVLFKNEEKIRKDVFFPVSPHAYAFIASL